MRNIEFSSSSVNEIDNLLGERRYAGTDDLSEDIGDTGNPLLLRNRCTA